MSNRQPTSNHSSNHHDPDEEPRHQIRHQPRHEVPHHVDLEIISHSHAKPLEPPPDLTFDVRELHNPSRDTRKHFDGRDRRLRDEMRHDPEFIATLDSARDQICDFVMAGHATVRVGVTCVRGRHRSVAFAEELSRKQNWFQGWTVSVRHRDVDRLKSEVDGEVRRARRREDRRRIEAGLPV